MKVKVPGGQEAYDTKKEVEGLSNGHRFLEKLGKGERKNEVITVRGVV